MKSTYHIGYVRLKVSFNLTKINILKTRKDVCICAHSHELAKFIHRKLFVADFQCKYKWKITLNVNIDN